MNSNQCDLPQFAGLYDWGLLDLRMNSWTRWLRQVSGQLRKVPFDPDVCASRMGVTVLTADLPEGISGRLRLDISPPTIEIRKYDDLRKRRFTMCHELCHLYFLSNKPVLSRERGLTFQMHQIQQREEFLCNKMAAELLMPKSAFVRHCKMLSPSFFAISRLAATFVVSIPATVMRICELRVWPIGAMLVSLSNEERTRKPARRWIRLPGKAKTSISHRRLRSRISAALNGAEQLLVSGSSYEKELYSGDSSYWYRTIEVGGKGVFVTKSSFGKGFFAFVV